MMIRTLNMSNNKITELPLSMRHMKDLAMLNVDHNPLLMPPTHVRGIVADSDTQTHRRTDTQTHRHTDTQTHNLHLTHDR